MNHDEIRAQQDAMKAAVEANAWAEYVFSRAQIHWRKADDVSLYGCITSRLTYAAVGLDERDVLRVAVKRESGGLLR